MSDVRGRPYELRPIGWVQSPLVDRRAAPKQSHEGSPDAWLLFDPAMREVLIETKFVDSQRKVAQIFSGIMEDCPGYGGLKN